MLYILNWVWRANYEPHYTHSPLLYFGGIIQTLLYADFFYYYGIRYVDRSDKTLTTVCLVTKYCRRLFERDIYCALRADGASGVARFKSAFYSSSE